MSWDFICALGRIRTCDTGFRRAVLYPLSYEGVGSGHVSVPAALGSVAGGVRRNPNETVLTMLYQVVC
ncbi:hypothetical protein RHCRD62_60451 [Rhodococcus sp. RD6.2]|nr:hypothetical protein RHCRD62_60451 [Rhodococcus sp. RD6.2]